MARFTLAGDHVRLVPLEVGHAAELSAAAEEDRTTYGFTDVPKSTTAMEEYIERLLDQATHGMAVPFAQQRIVDGALVGCTRFMELRRWRGRDEPDEVEIGGTWLAASAQRGPINTEAKLLLLTHAFDTWNVVRVALCTDAGNERSRTAIARLGAQFEGILRHHRPLMRDGEPPGPRDSALFSITDEEWPAVRRQLRQRLGKTG